LAKAADPRIVRVPSAVVASSSSEVILRNSYGLNLQDSGSYFFSYTSLVAKDGASTAVNGKVAVSSRFDGIDPEKIAADVTELKTYMSEDIYTTKSISLYNYVEKEKYLKITALQ